MQALWKYGGRMKYGLITGLLWFFGIFFVVRGITLIGESFLGCLFMVLAGLLLLPVVRAKLSAEKEAKEASQKQQRETEKQQRNNIIAIQTDSRIALKNYLKDPDSADIRNHHGNCGEVNSKNGFGGYTGFKRFIASSAIVAIEGENMDSDEFQKAWDQVCK